jgi:hypothetical protein
VNTPGIDWLQTGWASLPEEVWLAVDEQGIRAQALDCEVLLAILSKQDIKTSDVLILLRRDGKEAGGSNLF